MLILFGLLLFCLWVSDVLWLLIGGLLLLGVIIVWPIALRELVHAFTILISLVVRVLDAVWSASARTLLRPAKHGPTRS